MTTIALFDKGGGNFYRDAKKAAEGIFGVGAATTFSAPDNASVESLRRFSHIVCHVEESTPEPSWKTLIEGELPKVEVIIRVSRVGLEGMNSFTQPFRLKSDGAWIFHLIEGSGTVDLEGWKRIFSACKDWNPSDSSPSAALMEIFDPHPDVRLAFRLLCEATKECGKGGRKDRAFGTEISIHAPDGIEDWLSPFGETGSDKIEQVVERIAGGKIGKQVKAVLEAVRDEGNVLKAIEEFETEQRKPAPAQA